MTSSRPRAVALRPCERLPPPAFVASLQLLGPRQWLSVLVTVTKRNFPKTFKRWIVGIVRRLPCYLHQLSFKLPRTCPPISIINENRQKIRKNSWNWKWKLWFHEKYVVLSFDGKSGKTREILKMTTFHISRKKLFCHLTENLKNLWNSWNWKW